MYDEKFIDVFNEHYPFERYIVKNPKAVGLLFDDALLTEIFIPDAEEKANRLYLNKDEISIKIQGPAGEMRFWFYDFEEHIRLNIIRIIIEDIGDYQYECLYIDNEDMEPLIDELKTQKSLIEKKYNICKIKQNLVDKSFANESIYK